MSYDDALVQARQNSIDYPDSIIYVIGLPGGKRYSVISEVRYNSRGLEDPVAIAFENGTQVA